MSFPFNHQGMMIPTNPDKPQVGLDYIMPRPSKHKLPKPYPMGRDNGIMIVPCGLFKLPYKFRKAQVVAIVTDGRRLNVDLSKSFHCARHQCWAFDCPKRCSHMDTGDSILGFLSNLDLVSDAVEKVLVKQSFWSKDVWLHRCFQCPPKLSTLGDFGTMRFNDTLVALVLAGDLGKVVLEMLRGL